MLKQTLQDRRLGVMQLEETDSDGRIPENLAVLTNLLLSMHSANGDLDWVRDMILEFDDDVAVHSRIPGMTLKGEINIPGYEDRLAKAYAELSSNIPMKHDVNGPGTGMWQLMSFVANALYLIRVKDTRYENPENDPFRVLGRYLLDNVFTKDQLSVDDANGTGTPA